MKRILSFILTMLMLVGILAVAPVSVGAEAQTITVYFENNWLWSDVFYHSWGSSVVADTTWGQGALELVGTSVNGNDVYKATIGSDATGIVFAGTKNDGSGSIDQTPDILEGFYDGVCYSMTWNVSNAVVANDIADVCPDLNTTPDPEPTPDPEEPAESCTVYFVDYPNSFSEVYAYAWSGDGDTADVAAAWPGVKMELTGEALSENAAEAGGLVYSVTFEKTYDNIIFAGKNADGDISGQTEDLTLEAGKYCYWGTESWYSSIEEIEADYPATEPEPTPDPEEPDATGDEPQGPYTVYYVDSANNFAEVYAYAWSGEGDTADIAAEWPGVKMELTGEALSENALDAGGLVYRVTFEKAYDNIVFAGTYEVGNAIDTQTEDLAFKSGKYLYWTDEYWYSSIEEIEEAFPADNNETETEYIKVYFQNNWLWSEVSIYYWGSATVADTEYPGIAMDLYENDGTYDVYSAYIPADVEGFLIDGIMDDGSDRIDKTPDITEGFYDGICYYMTWDNGNAVGSVDISEIFPEETTAKFMGYSARLEGNIAFNLHFDISDDVMADPDAKLVVTQNGNTKEIPVTELEYWGESSYIYTATVSAKNMTDTITVQILTSLIETESADTSVKKYLEGFLKNPDMFPAQQDIAKALLNYGTAAQIYFGYNTDPEKLANNTEYMTDADRTVAVKDLSYYAPIIEGANDGDVKYVGAALVLKSETSLKFYFTVENTDAYENFGINVNGPSGATLTQNGDYYEFVITDLYAHNLGDTYTLGTGSATIKYSAMSYAYLAQQSSKTELVNLANALVAYFEAASLYGSN